MGSHYESGNEADVIKELSIRINQMTNQSSSSISTSTTTSISTTTPTTSTTSTYDCGECVDWLSPVLFWSVTGTLLGVVILLIAVFCCYCLHRKRKNKKLKKKLDSNQKFANKHGRSRTKRAKTNGSLGRF